MRRVLKPRYLIPPLLLFAVLMAFNPEIKYRIVGWWRGEPCYRGQPASYYAAVLPPILRDREQGRLPERSIWTSFLEWYSRGWSSPVGMDQDPRAVPVLRALLEYPHADDRVRVFAALCLGINGARDEREEAVDQLVRHVRDDSPEVQCSAACGLWAMGERLDIAGPLLVETIHPARRRPFVLFRLRQSPPSGSASVFAKALASQDHGLRTVAVEALAKIARTGNPHDRRVARDGLVAATRDSALDLRTAATKALERLDTQTAVQQP
jgi:hypothetical protein